LSLRPSLIPLSLLSLLLLSACQTTRSTKSSQAERLRLYQLKSEQLDSYDGWSFEGRLAVSNEKDGGSGQFRWEQGDVDSRMDFHGAMGRGAWELKAGGWGAELVLADGTVYRADSIDQLVRRHVGWQVPVKNMSWWVRGMAVPGKFARRDLDEDGNISLLKQDGWTVVYDRYQSVQDHSLPSRLTATKKDWKVKLAIRGWSLLKESDGLD